MIGMKSSHKPLRGIMAEKMLAYARQVETAKQHGKAVRMRPSHETNIHLVEDEY